MSVNVRTTPNKGDSPFCLKLSSSAPPNFVFASSGRRRLRESLFFLVLLFLASPLSAQDIGLSDKDSAWMLLQDPIGQAGDGLNEFAGDPGQPVLNPLGWPGGNWPTTELWHFDANTGKFRQATDFLGGYIDEASKKNWRRTLTSVVRISDAPHVLHYDPFKLSGHMSALLLVNKAAASAKGKVPEANIVFKSENFFDAPEVSPDGKRIVLRFWISTDSGYKSEIRMYSLPDFELIATSDQSTHSRPVWISNNSVAVVTWPNGNKIPYQRAMDVSKSRDNPRLHTRNAHDKGLLVQLSVEGLLKSDPIREAYYLGDKTRRTLVFDGTRLAWVEDELGKPQVLAKDMKTDEVSVIVEGFKGFQGLSANKDEILSTVYGHADNPSKLCVIKSFLNPPKKKKKGPEEKDEVADGDEKKDDEKKVIEPLVMFLRGGDRTIHASMLDFGNGMLAFAEPVANHEFSMEVKSSQPAIQHTLRVPKIDFDSLRNPRMLVQISGMMRSFSQFDTGKAELASTQLIFDVDVVSGKNQRSGRMIEVYHAASRKGKGAIRIEDNLGGGTGTFRSIYDDRGSDFFFSGTNINDGVKKQAKPAAGKAFDELESQLNARRMLTLTNASNSLDAGGLKFFGRSTHRDPKVGTVWNVVTYLKRGRSLGKGQFEQIWLTFVTALPTGAAGDWAYPHALCKAQMRFAMANARGLQVTDLMFFPDDLVEIKRLTVPMGKNADDYPVLLLPNGFRIYNIVKGKPVLAVEAKLVSEKVKGFAKFTGARDIQSGYYLPSMGKMYVRSSVERKFTEFKR